MSFVSTAPVCASDAAAPLWRRAALHLGAAVIVAVSAYMSAALDMARVWWETTTYNHGFLVAPAAAWMMWARRDEVLSAPPRPALSALFATAAAAAAMVAGTLADVDLMRHGALVLTLMSLFPLCFGWAFARRFWFPILFLGFMAPFGDMFIPALQEATADVSVWMLRASGVPVFRHGVMIELPNALFEVAEACAGLRFLIANIVIAAAFAYLSFDKAWKWAVFAVLAVAVPIFANFLRAYGVMMIGHLSNGALAAGVDHLVYGWVFFALVMMGLLWIGGLFADRPLSQPSAPPARNAGSRALWRGPAGILGAAVVVFAASLFAAAPNQPGRPAPAALPAALSAGWNQVYPAVPAWAPVFDSADAVLTLSLQKDDFQVEVFVAYYTHQRDGAEVAYFANRFDDNEIWKRAQAPWIGSLPGSNGPAQRERLTHLRSGGAPLTRHVAAWRWVGETLAASAWEAKLAHMRARLSGGPPEALVVAVSAVGDDAEQAMSAWAQDIDLASVLKDL